MFSPQQLLAAALILVAAWAPAATLAAPAETQRAPFATETTVKVQPHKVTCPQLRAHSDEHGCGHARL